jgi:hypothetical protein
MEKCNFFSYHRLGHRKYRYLYRQTYRTPFWLNQNIKALGY